MPKSINVNVSEAGTGFVDMGYDGKLEETSFKMPLERIMVWNEQIEWGRVLQMDDAAM